MDEVSEEELREAEERPADHDHDGLEPTEQAIRDHLVAAHAMEVPDGVSWSTLEGMHDRFHGEAHASKD